MNAQRTAGAGFVEYGYFAPTKHRLECDRTDRWIGQQERARRRIMLDLGGTFHDFWVALFDVINQLLSGVFGFLADFLNGLNVTIT
jgi:hypothetical protein